VRMFYGFLAIKELRRALLLMEQNINSPIRIENIASRLQTSRRTLERLFGRNMGTTPLKAYLDLRLRHARSMLQCVI
jgi:transcriptional regulator GlxA family with amidase domain